MEGYRIRNLNREELTLAIDWAAAEGWNPGLNDADLFYFGDANGFFAGEIDGRIVAVGSAVCYDDHYAFCGLYIVDPQFRGRGLGLALTKARLEYCADRNVGIDGVLENVAIYQRLGYRPFYMNHRFQTQAQELGFDDRWLKPIREEHMDDILAYDRRCFPASRELFLREWIRQAEGKAIVFECENQVRGFAVQRRCREGYKIGPLFADDSHVARELLNALQSDIPGATLYLDVPENNHAAMDLVREYSMQEVFATMRMYRDRLPEVEHRKVFGITTFELG